MGYIFILHFLVEFLPFFQMIMTLDWVLFSSCFWPKTISFFLYSAFVTVPYSELLIWELYSILLCCFKVGHSKRVLPFVNAVGLLQVIFYLFWFSPFLALFYINRNAHLISTITEKNKNKIKMLSVN